MTTPPAVRLERSAGRYRAVWTDPRTRKRRTRNIGRVDQLSQRQAEQERRRIEHEMAADPAAMSRDRPPTLAEWVARYFELRPELGEATAKLQRHAAELFIDSAGPGRRLDTLMPEDAAAHRQLLASRTYQGRQLTEATIAKHLRALRAIFGERYGAMRYGAIRANPFAHERGLNPPVDEAAHYLARADLARLLSNDRSHTSIAVAIARLAGLRLGEIKRLTWDDVDLAGGRIHVHTPRVTTKRRPRVVPLDPQLADILHAHYDAAPTGATHVVTLPEYNFYTILPRRLKLAGLAPWPKPMHTLRKNCETDWLTEHPVVDVCKWLGHSPTIAMKHYHQSRPEVMDRVAKPATDIDALAKLIDDTDPAAWLPKVRSHTRDRIAAAIGASHASQ